MIFDVLTLKNFGVYRGTQSATLTPEPGKPIILFGGMNGGGKTTMLDAVQLALYGSRARVSNRGSLTYKDYLRETINRAAGSDAVSGVSLTFRRMVDGKYVPFQISRTWRVGSKGVEEQTEVMQNGVVDPIATSHWDETIDAYLPNSIAHLFFFDGEQIVNLAESEHAAEILRTAIHSLLGLDLVDRLETDLKVFERRKRAEELDSVATAELIHLRSQLEELDAEQARLITEEGSLVNQLGRKAKDVAGKESQYRAEGGELFEQRAEIDRGLASLRADKQRTEAHLRELATGILPLAMLRTQLASLRELAEHEDDIRRAKALLSLLDGRDQMVLTQLDEAGLPTKSLAKIASILEADRNKRAAAAKGQTYLNAPAEFQIQIEYLETSAIDVAEHQARALIDIANTQEEQLAQVECNLERIPSTDRVNMIKAELGELRGTRDQLASELEVLRTRKAALTKTRQALDVRLDRVGQDQFDHAASMDDKARFLRHSTKVRGTLKVLRGSVVRQHAEHMQELILNAFRQLLRKQDLVSEISIDPDSFAITLKDASRKPLPFGRLSAGERQLLATSLLWGLARASGRPIPTMIDTPLGRLDSTHRMHLASRYFPNASHQVVLLSTDEELVDGDLAAIQPFVTRTYLLKHDDKSGTTRIEAGYFQ